MSKIIYQPKGKAKEYSPWAANFYNGCSNRCDYCYNRHCQAKALLGKDEPTLKKGLGCELGAYQKFQNELEKYRERIIEDGKGLFFNFVSDPMLPETRKLNMLCIEHAIFKDVPCVILTKCADWYDDFVKFFSEGGLFDKTKEFVKVGFTLTGCDELEHCTSTNEDRIELMRKLHKEGFKTWASIEPVIDVYKSWKMINSTFLFCDEYKVGLLSGKKEYTRDDVKWLVSQICSLPLPVNSVYLKDSIIDFFQVKPWKKSTKPLKRRFASYTNLWSKETGKSTSGPRVVLTKEYRMHYNIWEYTVGIEGVDHPAVFPIRLAKDMIYSYSNEGDVVFDPFLGSGTTAVAAMQLKRNFIGTEIVPDYFDSACKRINAERAQLTLF